MGTDVRSLELDDRLLPYLLALVYPQEPQHEIADPALSVDTHGPLDLRHGSLHYEDHRAQDA